MSKSKKNQILQRDAEVLRQVAKPVPVEEIESKRIQDIIRKMSKAMHAESDGVAIAAPQIGESLRIFLVNTRALESVKNKDVEHSMLDKKEERDLEDMVFINPKVLKLSRKKEMMEEGCLSVRWLYGYVSRSEKATVEAYDQHGKKFQMGASGLLAQIFQHETDHLDGVLFVDKAKDVQDMPPSKEDDVAQL